MGLSIEEAIKYYENKNVVLTEEEALANTLALNTMRKYQQLQADYENRLKADLVAILEDLKQDIIAESWHIECYDVNANDLVVQISDVDMVIQQKINSLKEDKKP